MKDFACIKLKIIHISYYVSINLFVCQYLFAIFFWSSARSTYDNINQFIVWLRWKKVNDISVIPWQKVKSLKLLSVTLYVTKKKKTLLDLDLDFYKSLNSIHKSSNLLENISFQVLQALTHSNRFVYRTNFTRLSHLPSRSTCNDCSSESAI